MSRKVLNPFKDLDGYNCFGCSPGNQIGLQMNFYEEADCRHPWLNSENALPISMLRYLMQKALYAWQIAILSYCYIAILS